MEAVIDNGFSLSYRDEVLHFIFPLFPQTTSRNSSHVHAITRLLITLSSPSLTVPFLVSLVPKEPLLAYQFAFDLVEGGAQDYLESVRTALPEGASVTSNPALNIQAVSNGSACLPQDTKPIFDKMRSILTGQESVKLYLEFLKHNNHVDLAILKNTKVCEICDSIVIFRITDNV